MLLLVQPPILFERWMNDRWEKHKKYSKTAESNHQQTKLGTTTSLGRSSSQSQRTHIGVQIKLYMTRSSFFEFKWFSGRSVPLYRCEFGKWRPSQLSILTIEQVSRFARRTSLGVPAFPDSFVSSILAIFKRQIYVLRCTSLQNALTVFESWFCRRRMFLGPSSTRGRIAQIWQIRGLSVHSRVYLSPVGRAPKFDKYEFASAHHVDFYTVVFIWVPWAERPNLTNSSLRRPIT
jgi:hypothetical protein